MDAGILPGRGLRARLKRCGLLVEAVGLARSLPRAVRALAGRLRRGQRIRQYFLDRDVRKLQVGCGRNVLEGWLNGDVHPRSGREIYLDAAQPLPFPDASFDRVFAEHLIEHLGYADGQRFLRECFRVLKPGGRVRISTPDLGRLASLLCCEPRQPAHPYVRWLTDWCFPGLGVYEPAIVVNHCLKAWGHRFLYDRPTLERSLGDAGFRSVIPAAVGGSADPHFDGIDGHPQAVSDPDMGRWETLVLEADRSPAE